MELESKDIKPDAAIHHFDLIYPMDKWDEFTRPVDSKTILIREVKEPAEKKPDSKTETLKLKRIIKYHLFKRTAL